MCIRDRYWSVYGGSPGWAFLLGGFADQMRARGLGDAHQETLFVANPSRLYAFSEVTR